MYVKKSDEQLIKEYAEIGVDYNKFVEFGEMNVIVQSFAIEDHEAGGNEIINLITKTIILCTLRNLMSNSSRSMPK